MTARSLRVLLFTRTCGYRHDSTKAAIAALERVARERGWTLEATEDPSVFTAERLRDRDVTVFLSTSGEVLDAEQKAAFGGWVRTRKGFVGIHGAADTEYHWPLYGKLIGAYFKAHPAIQPATVVVEREHAATRMFPARFRWVDEWYAFARNPRPHVEVLLTLDESSYSPGSDGMGGDHPIAWCHEVEGTRAFYTALGHTAENWADVAFLAHVAAAVEWAGS